MSVSIYYTAKRSVPLTPEEREAVSSIVQESCASFPFRESEEEFYLYDDDPSEPETILDGCTKLPDDIEEMLVAALHWAGCLTGIRRALAESQWHVNIDDTDLVWDDADGWQFPTA